VNDRPTWGPPTPPPYPYPYPYAPVPQKKPGIGHIVAYIVGGVLFAVGAFMFVWANQGYGMCQSSVGVLGQAANSTTASMCGVFGVVHSVSLILLAAGGITALIGALVRMGRSS
jgi:hypothetical protein